MDLVEEQDRPLSSLAEALTRPFDRLADVLDPGVHRRELLEGPIGAAGDCESKRRLAGARRAPQQRRRQPVGLDETAQRLARPDEVVLADDIVDRARSQPGRQWSAGSALLLGGHREEVVAHGVSTAR